jgi:hypothetical protein
MILMDLILFFAILYNAEIWPVWKIYSLLRFRFEEVLLYTVLLRHVPRGFEEKHEELVSG